MGRGNEFPKPVPMMGPVALWMLTMHLLGDFPLQTDWMAEKKSWLHSPGERAEGAVTLFIHVLIHGFLFVPIALYTLTGTAQLIFIAWVMVSHFIIDSRRWFDPKESWDWGHDGMAWVWLNDQILHLVALSLAYPITEIIHAAI